jgi:hypothetical protein
MTPPPKGGKRGGRDVYTLIKLHTADSAPHARKYTRVISFLKGLFREKRGQLVQEKRHIAIFKEG